MPLKVAWVLCTERGTGKALEYWEERIPPVEKQRVRQPAEFLNYAIVNNSNHHPCAKSGVMAGFNSVSPNLSGMVMLAT
jgi:hypothetical protein